MLPIPVDLGLLDGLHSLAACSFIAIDVLKVPQYAMRSYPLSVKHPYSASRWGQVEECDRILKPVIAVNLIKGSLGNTISAGEPALSNKRFPSATPVI